MVGTTMFILQLIGLFIILYWAITNDRPGGERSGLLAMRSIDGEPVARPSQRDRGYRSSLVSSARGRDDRFQADRSPSVTNEHTGSAAQRRPTNARSSRSPGSHDDERPGS